MAKKKRMTVREKKERAELKKLMQEKGIIPPDKPKMNRKKFVESAKEQWRSQGSIYDLLAFLPDAMGLVLNDKDRNGRVTMEAVGVARMMKLAVRLREFYEKLKEEGRTTYKLEEQFDYIEDILRA